MMLLMLPALMGIYEEQDVLPDDKTMNTERPFTVLMTISVTASSLRHLPPPYKKLGKRKELQLQQ